MKTKRKGNYRKTSPGGISKDRNKVGASFKIECLYLFFLKNQIAVNQKQLCKIVIAKSYIFRDF